MKYKLRIEGSIYEFKGYEFLKIGEFMELIKELDVEPSLAYYTILKKMFKVPVKVLGRIDIESLNQVDFNSILSVEPGMFEYRKLKWGDKPDFSSITIGQFADTEHFFITSDENRLEKLVAQLINMDNTIEQHEELSKKIQKELLVGDALRYQHEYSEFRNKIFNSYESLFNKETNESNDTDDPEKREDHEEKEDTDWGWQGVIFQLANEDITKVDDISSSGLIKCLNFLSYRKEENEKMKAEIDKKRTQNKLS